MKSEPSGPSPCSSRGAYGRAWTPKGREYWDHPKGCLPERFLTPGINLEINSPTVSLFRLYNWAMRQHYHLHIRHLFSYKREDLYLRCGVLNIRKVEHTCRTGVAFRHSCLEPADLGAVSGSSFHVTCPQTMVATWAELCTLQESMYQETHPHNNNH